MPQQSAKLSPWLRITIVGLIVLVPMTGLAITYAPEPFRTRVHDTLVNPSLVGAAIVALERVKNVARKW
jgi:hypothetical protein